MPELFLRLEAEEQSRIYRALAPQLARSPAVLEKDVWVCWVLETLFKMPDRLPMAFKGGTSLSKVFGVIKRFSEDVDITLDYRGLDGTFNPFVEGVSRSRLKKFSDELKTFVSDHVHDVVAPWFQRALENQFDSRAIAIEVSNDGEQFRVYYPSVLDAPGDYMGNSVLVEFGGRNITDPNEEHEVRPDISEYLPELNFPSSKVNVLSPERTFWEKATLMHVECQRGDFRVNAERLSRHWYDLAMMADHAQGQSALNNRSLLEDVVKHKRVFYNASYANYDACLTGQLKLVPEEEALIALQNDFQRMIAAGMFIGEPPAFQAIIQRLRTLEASINNLR